MPSDVTGNMVYESATGTFRFRPGPLFANLVLADEINRTPPKTQAALLEAMEERQVTVEGEAYPLPSPFLVVATQNPVEFEGTYPLPEAQLDRFLLKLRVGYPGHDPEMEVLRMHHQGRDPHDLAALGVRPVAGAAALDAAARDVVGVTVAEELFGYIWALADQTRRSPSLALGVSPRGAAMLLNVAKAWAYLSGRAFVTPDDGRALGGPGRGGPSRRGLRDARRCEGAREAGLAAPDRSAARGGDGGGDHRRRARRRRRARSRAEVSPSRRQAGAGRPGMYATLRFVAVVLAASVVAALLPGPAWLGLLAGKLAALVALAIDVRIAPGPASLQAALDVPAVVALDLPAKGTLRLQNPTGRRLKVATHE